MKIIKTFIKTILFSLTLILCVFIYSRYIEPNMITVKDISIGAGEDQVNIVLFSDTHYGKLYSEYKSENITKVINEQNADIVVFGGDLIDSYAADKPDIEIIKTTLRDIEAKSGKFAVWGNHDYGGGSSRIFDEIMEYGGFTILENQNVLIEDFNINILGLDDILLGNPDLNITEGVNSNTFNILISHEPDIVDELDLKNINLILSGHTHGGQVKIPYITKFVLPPGGEKYIDGLYDVKSFSDTQIYVTTGLGVTKMPFRFMNTPEIINLTINY